MEEAESEGWWCKWAKETNKQKKNNRVTRIVENVEVKIKKANKQLRDLKIDGWREQELEVGKGAVTTCLSQALPHYLTF